MVKEKLDKYILDENQGFISKIVKLNENTYVLYELDFYPVQIYEKSFGMMVRAIEKAKIWYEKLNEQKAYIQLPEKEQNKIKKEKEKKQEKINKKIEKYKEKRYKIDNQLRYNEISQEEYDIKRKELHDKYEDIFQKREKAQNDYEVDISMEEFKDTLVKYKNNLIKEKIGEIKLYPRYKTPRAVTRVSVT